jgi:putative copper export protein
MLDAGTKSALYIGVVLLLGAGVFRYLVIRGDSSFPLLHKLGILLGAVMVAMGTILNLVQTVVNVLGQFDAAFVWEYANATRHGSASYVRLGLTVLIVLMLLIRPRASWAKPLFYLTSLAFLATFSSISHGASMGGILPLTADLIHSTSATIWAGAVVYSATLLQSARNQQALEPGSDQRLSATYDRCLCLFFTHSQPHGSL